MRIKTVALDDLTRNILLRSVINGCNLTLPEQLPREDYTRVAKAIEAAGGKWNRKARCHIFPHDVRETLNISDDTVEVINVQQTNQAFYTPYALAKKLVDLADVWGLHRVLEPSAGEGALIEAVIGKAIRVQAVEIDPRLCKTIEARWPGLKTYCADFLTCRSCHNFDRVIMNPPFSMGDDIKHIKHALTFLKPGGRLVSICANGPKQHQTFMPIADAWIDLEPGAFKESGTNVNTAIVVIQP